MTKQSTLQARLKSIIRRVPLFYTLQNLRMKIRQQRNLRQWLRQGKPMPPPHIVKQTVLKEYANHYNLRTLIETGTFHGDMVQAMKKYFDMIYSIELSDHLYEKAKYRFRKNNNVAIIHGDSGEELKNLMNKIDTPTLFWLDGHYSAGQTAKGPQYTPILRELEHILDAPDLGHVIIIDDANCFKPDSPYPAIEDLTAYVISKRDNVNITVENNSIRIIPS